MIDILSERRVKLADKYKLYIEVPEKEYLIAYENNVNVENARDILWQYLDYYQDDARIENVEINYDRGNHSINIEADLIYVGNDHTSVPYRANYLRDEKELRE